MEKLAGKVTSKVLPNRPRRNIYLCPSESIQALPELIDATSPHFGLLLALDANLLDVHVIGDAAEKLLERGLVYLCAWGPKCERVHDIFDEVSVECDPEQVKAVVMTTWHTDDTLQETVWFFVDSAFPDDAYEPTCNDWIIAPIGNPEWEQAIRKEMIGSDQ